MLPISIIRTANPKPKPKDEGKLGFGGIFTDHMFICNYKRGIGWHNARIVPYGPFQLEPSSMVLHYSQTVFEGLKCYRRAEGGLQLFRVKDNFARMNRSAARLGMPALDDETFLAGLAQLLKVDKDWVPGAPGTSLYIRPAMMAVDAKLGVHAANEYVFFIILSPVGAYYPGGIAPNDIYVEDRYVRAVRGGIGETKVGANYAASMLASMNAEEKGFAQVLWLDGVEQKYIEEVGSMNILFVYDGNTVLTPALSGSILPGITRDSVLKLCEHLGYETRQEKMDIHTVLQDIGNGRVTESFGSGTAAVISPVKAFTYQGKTYQLGNGGIGPLSQKLYDTLTGIQFGSIKDEFGWITQL